MAIKFMLDETTPRYLSSFDMTEELNIPGYLELLNNEYKSLVYLWQQILKSANLNIHYENVE